MQQRQHSSDLRKTEDGLPNALYGAGTCWTCFAAPARAQESILGRHQKNEPALPRITVVAPRSQRLLQQPVVLNALLSTPSKDLLYKTQSALTRML